MNPGADACAQDGGCELKVSCAPRTKNSQPQSRNPDRYRRHEGGHDDAVHQTEQHSQPVMAAAGVTALNISAKESGTLFDAQEGSTPTVRVSNVLSIALDSSTTMGGRHVAQEDSSVLAGMSPQPHKVLKVNGWRRFSAPPGRHDESSARTARLGLRQPGDHIAPDVDHDATGHDR